MTEPLERDDLIGLLNRLGSDSDEEVLEAARQAHARIAAAGMRWDELLVPDEAAASDEDASDEDASDEDADDEDDSNSDDADDSGYQDPEDEPDEPPAEKARKNAESLALIGKLLAKPDTSNDLREELEGYKTDIAEDEFEESDRRYLRALAQRLSKRR